MHLVDRQVKEWRDDFVVLARDLLKIKDKSGRLIPFILNEAQTYVHRNLENQLADIGLVRSIILKGRQQGLCYTPDMRVLTSDYRWVAIGDVFVGDRLMAVDEDTGLTMTESGRKSERRIRNAIVEAKHTFCHDVYEIELSSGTKLKATGEHRHLCKKRGGDDTQWREVLNTEEGDFIRSAFYKPDDHSLDYEDGWFAGMLDGEGTFAATPAIRIGVCQVDGPVLRRMKKYLDNAGIRYYELIDDRKSGESSKLGNKPVHCLRIDRMTDVAKLITRTRPSRFVSRELFVGKKLPKSCEGFEAWQKVLSIKKIGKREVVDIQTSEKTYICEGIVSHNSTYVSGRFFGKTALQAGKQAFILTHEQAATDNLFGMTQRYLENYPEPLKPELGASNAKEMVFSGLGSGYRVATAGNKAAGRSATAQYMHASEVAYWPNAKGHMSGIVQTIPMEPGTEIIVESTANGIGNVFHDLWNSYSWQSIFVPWFWQREYRIDSIRGVRLSDEDRAYGEIYELDEQQIAWRRYKINEMGDDRLFMREYPSTPAEAFSVSDDQSLIDSGIVAAARKSKAQPHGAKILGVDPARFGDDRTAVVIRQGRCAEIVELIGKQDTMEVAGAVVKSMQKYSPQAVFVDMTGLGAGVVDRLRELGHANIVHGIGFGAKPIDQQKYVNKRAEMWGLMAKWLNEPPVQIPDDDEMEIDLCGLHYSYDSLGRLKLERKEDAKKRGLKSPDVGDALALTFAMPVGESEIFPITQQIRKPAVSGMGY